MKQIFTKTILALLIVTGVNAGDKFNNLSEDYLTQNASLDVRMTIAKDPKSSLKVLKILTHDSNAKVSQMAKKAIH